MGASYGPPLSGSRTQTGMPPVFREDTRTIVAVDTTLKKTETFLKNFEVELFIVCFQCQCQLLIQILNTQF